MFYLFYEFNLRKLEDGGYYVNGTVRVSKENHQFEYKYVLDLFNENQNDQLVYEFLGGHNNRIFNKNIEKGYSNY